MARKYDSSRREAAAQKTREQILVAAIELHGQCIFDYESLAEAANVSLPTLRKHFPNRELLFQGCTSWAMHHSPVPDLDELRSVDDHEQLLVLAVRQTHRFYESLYGQLWAGMTLASESPTLARGSRETQEMAQAIAELVAEKWGLRESREACGFASGLLGYLAYRSLREDGGLTDQEATVSVTEMLRHRFERIVAQEGGGSRLSAPFSR